ncbi:MAG: DUF624 domain-containing protein [Spirochaetales bacterium]|nr:DUF624 domain-containing protein [Spirochaetales bacterium]MBQ7509107.1 DUF624 domain-containing protein [Spirochaetales bacterium]
MKKFLKRTLGEEMDSLIILNLITCGLCLTVVCAGPAVLALTGLIIKINDDRADKSRIREYFALFKKKFVNGLIYEIVLAAYVAVLIASQTLGLRLETSSPAVSMVVQTLVILGFFIAAIVSVCTSIVLSAWETPFGTGLWNGICLAFGKLPRAFLSALVVYGFLYLLYPVFWPVSAVFYIFIMISLTCVMKVAFMWAPVCTLLLDRKPDFDAAEANARAMEKRTIESDDIQEMKT